MEAAKEKDVDPRNNQTLHSGDQIHCKNGDTYTITDRLLRFGGSAILYSADKTSSGILNGIRYIIKECFPKEGAYERREGIVAPVSEDEVQRKTDQLKLNKLRANFVTEFQIGQKLAEDSDRIIGAEGMLQVEFISTEGRNYPVEDSCFLLMKEKKAQGAFLPEILQECGKTPEAGYPLRTGGLPSVHTSMKIMEQVLLALADIHKNEYLHGDVQDGNLYFAGFGNKGEEGEELGMGCLLDFGCAKALYQTGGTYVTEKLQSGEIYSTPGFTAPEILQYNNGTLQLGREADLYAAGCLMYYLLTGEKGISFVSKRESRQLTREQFQAVNCPESVRKSVNDILVRALENVPENRYHSAGEMLRDISGLIRRLMLVIERPTLSMMTLGENEFVGRKSELREIDIWFRNKRNPVILYGFGGMGKTELAVEYGRQAAKKRCSHTYLVIFTESMYATVTGPIAQAFGCPVTKDRPEEQVYEEVIKKLRRNLTEDDLLVIDNVDDEQEEYETLVSSRRILRGEELVRIPDDTYRILCGLHAKVLITTRSERTDGIPVTEMLEAELVDLMKQFCKDRVSEVDMKRLIEAVNSHTLAVELIARMLATPSYPPMTPDDIIEYLKKGRAELLERKIESRKDRNQLGEEVKQKETFLGHIRTLFRMADLSDIGRRMMVTGVVLPQRGMDYTLFAECQEKYNQEVMEQLLKRGWLKLDGQGCLCIHMLIREVCLKEIRKESGEDKKTVIMFLEKLENKYEPDMMYDASKFLQMADTFANATNMMERNKDKYAYSAGKIYRSIGEYTRALQYGAKALEIREKVLNENHSDVTDCYDCIGLVYRNLGDYEKALKYLYKALEKRKEALPENHPKVAQSYYHVGIIYGDIGEYEESLICKWKGLKINQKILPKNHPNVARSYNSVGQAYGDLGKYEKALWYEMKALEIRKKVLPENHPQIASSYNYVGVTYSDLGEYEKALKYQLKALEISQEVLPKKHPKIATFCNNVGVTYSDLGEYEKALEYQLMALEMRKKILSEIHEDMANSYSGLGITYGRKGEYEKALVYQSKSFEIRKKILRGNPLNVAAGYNNMGIAHEDMGDHERAIWYLLKALEIRERVLSEGHPEVASSYNNVGIVYRNLGAYQDALDYQLKALRMREKVFSKNHPDVASSYYNVGSTYGVSGNHIKSVEYMQKALYMWKQSLSKNHPYITMINRSIEREVCCLRDDTEKS